MTLGEKLLISILNEGNELTISKINKDWLSKDEVKYKDFITEYYRENGELPKLSVLEDKFGIFEEEVSGTSSHYLKEVKARHIHSSMVENMPKLLKKLKSDPLKVFDEIKTVVSNAGVTADESKDVVYSKSAVDRFSSYKEASKNDGITYIKVGDPILDALMHGYKKTDLITLGGFPGVGKTWWLLYQAYICEQSLPKDAGPILVISNEIGSEEIIERLDCIRFGLDYDAFIKGSLTRKDTIKFKKGLEKLEKDGSKIIVVDNCTTIQDIDYKLGLFKPSIFMVDGSYLLEPNMKADDWKRIMFITRNLKMLCKSRGIPCVNTTQLKRKAGRAESKSSVEGQDDFAYGSSFVQDSDVTIKGYQTPDMEYESLVGLEFVKGRRLPPNTKLSWKRDLLQGIFKYDSVKAIEEVSEEESKVEY